MEITPIQNTVVLCQSKEAKQKQFATKIFQVQKLKTKQTKKQNEQEEHGTLLTKQSKLNSSSEIT